MKKIVIAIVALVILAGAGLWAWERSNRQTVSFRTVQVERGTLQATISSTGTVEPEDVVDVGAQVSGPIKEFGVDPRGATDSHYKNKFIDYGTPVAKGAVLAQIDPAIYKAQYDQAVATVDQNVAMVSSAEEQVKADQANVVAAKANSKTMEAKSWQSERDYQRSIALLPKGGIAQSDYDISKSTNDQNRAIQAQADAAIKQAEAQLGVDKAKVETAKAALKTAEAARENAKTNLDYCTIRAPVEGVVVDRRVNIGQTVVSSLSASSLFLLAKDLKRLQVWASVNEADVGNVRPGKRVTFTVDAFPGKVFQGTVHADQPRLNASMTQNVVTYTVVVDTDNSGKSKLTEVGRDALRRAGTPKEVLDKLGPIVNKVFEKKVNFEQELAKLLNAEEQARFTEAISNQAETGRLLPYLTANLTFEVKTVANTLKVPNTALRWKPRPEVVAPAFRQDYIASQKKTKSQEGAQAAGASKEAHDHGVLWKQEGDFVKPVNVKIGLSDGLYTQITDGDLSENDTIVLGENRGGGDASTSNPFAPSLFNKKQ